MEGVFDNISEVVCGIVDENDMIFKFEFELKFEFEKDIDSTLVRNILLIEFKELWPSTTWLVIYSVKLSNKDNVVEVVVDDDDDVEFEEWVWNKLTESKQPNKSLDIDS